MREVVAFQGVQGAYSEQAIRQQFGDSVDVYPCPSFGDLIDAITSRRATYGMLPVENSLAGSVSQAYELLMDSDLRIRAEEIVHVHHALIATSGTKLEDVKYVRSHPQALAQCDKYIKRNRFEAITWYDTAGSARDLAKGNVTHSTNGTAHTGVVAAIASELAAELYGLEILAREIEDLPFNYTRFFLLGYDDPEKGEYNKTSLVFAVRNQPSALYDCLGEFATRGLNLTKIESRPRRNRPWEPIFFVDVEGHWQDAPLAEALGRLLQRASFVKMLGSYPAVKTNWVGI